MSTLDKPTTSTQLIGRSTQLHTLVQLYQRAANGQGQLVLVSGEAGIGKSRLVAEALHALPKNGRVLQGHCFEQDRHIPYAPLLDIPQLAVHFTNMNDTADFDPEQAKLRRHHALRDFLVDVSNSRPLVLVIEDVHWCDDASVEFLTFLTRYLTAYPILVMLTYRSDEMTSALMHFLAAVDRQHMATEIQVPRLSHEDSNALLNGISNASMPLPGDVVKVVFALTEGNPFFIEEVFKSLLAAGDIVSRDGRWQVKPLDQLYIPRTVQVAVQQRTVRLTQEGRRVLTLAAVAGRRFDFSLLQHLTQHDEGTLLKLIKELMAAQLVIEESADIFAFRHALTRQAVYSSLLVRERRALHRQIAESLEALPALHVSDAAYHCYEAELWAQAANFAQEAGQQAQRLYALQAALDHFNRALTAYAHLQESPPVHLYRARGQVHELLGNLDKAHEDYEAAGSMAQQLGKLRDNWQSQLDLGFLWSSRDWGKAGVYLERAISLARQMNDLSTLAHSLNRVGNWYANQEQPHEALRYHQEALSIFEQMHDEAGLTASLDLLGVTSLMAGNMVASPYYYEQSIAHYRQLGDRVGLSSSLALYSMRGGSYMVENVYCTPTPTIDCLKDAEEALTITQEIGSRPAEAGTLMYAGLMLGARGDFDRALSFGRRGLELATLTDHQLWISGNEMLLGRLFLDVLDLTAAQDHLEASLSLAKSINAHYIIGATTGFLASTYIAENRFAQADSLLRMALRTDVQSPGAESMDTLVKRIMWGAQAELCIATGRPDSALEILDFMLAIANTPGDMQGVPRLLYLRAEALVAHYELKAAQSVLEQAAEIALAQDVQPLLWRIQIALGKVYQANSQRHRAENQFDEARFTVERLANNLQDTALRAHFLSRAAAFIPTLPPLSARQSARQTYDGLTEREREIAVQVAEGKSSREIAETLILSKRTVDAHIANILAKLGFNSRSQIARWAVEKGLI